MNQMKFLLKNKRIHLMTLLMDANATHCICKQRRLNIDKQIIHSKFNFIIYLVVRTRTNIVGGSSSSELTALFLLTLACFNPRVNGQTMRASSFIHSQMKLHALLLIFDGIDFIFHSLYGLYPSSPRATLSFTFLCEENAIKMKDN